jgi:Sulfatase-modifying factor enzyme 1
MRHVPKSTNRWAVLVLAMGVWYAIDGLAASAHRALIGNHAVGQTFRDCKPYCPEMVFLPPGRFTIGSPLSEVGRGSDENPLKVVTIGYAIVVGKYPVTRGEFAAFVEDTGRKLGPCEHWDGNSFRVEEGIDWRNAGSRPNVTSVFGWQLHRAHGSAVFPTRCSITSTGAPTIPKRLPITTRAGHSASL